MSHAHYVLVNHEPRLEADLLKWAEWFETADRTVRRQALLRGDPPEEYAIVSTVFLGLDHQWGSGPPLLFESMAFMDGDSLDGTQRRCSTWAQAEAQHVAVCKELEERFQKAPIARNWRRQRDEQRPN